MNEPELLVRQEGHLGRLTLNRPKALNALTHGMVRLMTTALAAWEYDASVKVVLIEGAGKRGLCAGGDIRALYDAAKIGDFASPIAFWADEYRLNARLASYPKPIVAVMDGVVMGGGVGISAHVRHRIVTETTMLAMPEAGIGFLPDVGGTYLLARAPGELGTYVALTAGRCSAADVLLLGLADVHVATDRLPELRSALQACEDGSVAAHLQRMSSNPAAGDLAGARGWIDDCFAFNTVEAIATRLSECAEPGAADGLARLQHNSPTSLKITLKALREARRLDDLRSCLVMELRAAAACISGHDMLEGIRAAVVDKDRAPRWDPSSLEEVSPSIVERHFMTLGGDELNFEAY